MQCPQCQFEMRPTDTVCPRCQGKGLPGQAVAPELAADDASSNGRVILGFFIPLLGGILYMKDRETRPKRARSAGLGALIGCGCWTAMIPVIFILAAILFPVFARARENARRASCQSNMKQLTLATMQFTMDNNGQLPDLSTPEAIRVSLGRYVKDPKIYTCPSGGDYLGNPQVHRVLIQSVSNPSQTPLLMETEGIHLDGHNVSFVDGHVKWYKAGEGRQ
jgi:prepilin-type processing-associated H-X9-DG protein